jgi:hypothetical protein
MMPNPDFSKKSCVSLATEPEYSYITAGTHLLLSFIQFKNFLINKEFSRFESEEPTFVTRVEALAKKMWSKDTGALNPQGLISYAMSKATSPDQHTPEFFIMNCLSEMGQMIFTYNFGTSSTFTKLLSN